MSVVNKMLNDLEQRSSLEGPDDLDGEYREPSEAQRVKKMLIFIGVVLLVAASYFTYRELGKDYFLDLYAQVMAQIQGEEENQKQTTKVSVNSAMNNMMPTRQGTTPPDSTRAQQETAETESQPASDESQLAEVTAATISDASLPELEAQADNNGEMVALGSEEDFPNVPVLSEEEPDIDPSSDTSQVVVVAESSNDDRIAELQEQASVAMAQNDVNSAINNLYTILNIDSSHHESRKKLAVLLFSNERLDAARSLLGDGVNLAEHRADFRLMLARIYYKERNYYDAYETLEPLEPSIQKNVEYYALQANVSQELGMFAEASHLYGRLALHEPDRAQWWLGLAVSLDRSGEHKGAVNAYERASDLRQLSASAEDFIRERILALGG